MPAAAFAQAEAANGNIEGTVRDATGAVVPGVTVRVLNTELGTRRAVVTSEQGFYRAPLLPLGAYTLTADMQGFRKFEQRNLTLSAGQTVVANIQLEVGGIELVPVDVSSTVSPAQAARIDLGRTIPYNFAFLQANVTGYENNEFGVPRINANGTQMHTKSRGKDETIQPGASNSSQTLRRTLLGSWKLGVGN